MTDHPIIPESWAALLHEDARGAKAAWTADRKPCAPAPGAIVIQLNARLTECIACGVFLVDPKQGIPLWEGEVVPVESDGPWGGFDACEECYALYEGGRYEELQAILWKPRRTPQGRT